jgi:hypothetical protein
MSEFKFIEHSDGEVLPVHVSVTAFYDFDECIMEAAEYVDMTFDPVVDLTKPEPMVEPEPVPESEPQPAPVIFIGDIMRVDLHELGLTAPNKRLELLVKSFESNGRVEYKLEVKQIGRWITTLP